MGKSWNFFKVPSVWDVDRREKKTPHADNALAEGDETWHAGRLDE